MAQLALPIAATVLAASLLFGARAEACEAHAAKKSETTSPSTASSSTAEAKPAPKTGDVLAPAVERTPLKSPSEVIDEALAGKCRCGGPSECTCKKGDCECGKCNKGKKKVTPLYESLKGASRVPGLENARYDATAGVFI